MLSGKTTATHQKDLKKKKNKKWGEKQISKLAVILKMYGLNVFIPIMCSVSQKTGCRPYGDLTRKETEIMFHRCAWH